MLPFSMYTRMMALQKFLYGAALTVVCMVYIGDIALIRAGEVHRIGPAGTYRFSDTDQFGIVSDTYVKWKGGKIPSAEEECKVGC